MNIVSPFYEYFASFWIFLHSYEYFGLFMNIFALLWIFLPFYEYFCMPLEKLVADELSKLDHDHNFRAPTWLRNIDTKWKQETHINTNTHAMPKNQFLDFKPQKSPLASHYLVLSISLLLFCNNQHHYITLTVQSVINDRYRVIYDDI